MSNYALFLAASLASAPIAAAAEPVTPAEAIETVAAASLDWFEPMFESQKGEPIRGGVVYNLSQPNACGAESSGATIWLWQETTGEAEYLCSVRFPDLASATTYAAALPAGAGGWVHRDLSNYDPAHLDSRGRRMARLSSTDLAGQVRASLRLTHEGDGGVSLTLSISSPPGRRGTLLESSGEAAAAHVAMIEGIRALRSGGPKAYEAREPTKKQSGGVPQAAQNTNLCGEESESHRVSLDEDTGLWSYTCWVGGSDLGARYEAIVASLVTMAELRWRDRTPKQDLELEGWVSGLSKERPGLTVDLRYTSDWNGGEDVKLTVSQQGRRGLPAPRR